LSCQEAEAWSVYLGTDGLCAVVAAAAARVVGDESS
jgi:hypothetical protein